MIRISLDRIELSVSVYEGNQGFEELATKPYFSYPLSYSSRALGMYSKMKYKTHAIYSQCGKTSSKENNHASLL